MPALLSRLWRLTPEEAWKAVERRAFPDRHRPPAPAWHRAGKDPLANE
jgi:hypothetical protein